MTLLNVKNARKRKTLNARHILKQNVDQRAESNSIGFENCSKVKKANGNCPEMAKF